MRAGCVVCGPKLLGDRRRVFSVNLSMLDDPVLLVTVTAPGDDVLPRGSDGRCEWGALHDWSRTIPKRWKALRDQATRAITNKGGKVPIYAYRWDLQKRGAPHIHLIVRSSTTARQFAERLGFYAERHGFGFVDTRLKDVPAWRAGTYLTRYLVKENERWTTEERRKLLPRKEFWVSPRLIEASFMSMRTCRKIRELHVSRTVEGKSFPRFKSEREMVAVSRHYRRVPVGDLGAFDATEYAEEVNVWTALDREAWEARLRQGERKARTNPAQVELDLKPGLGVEAA